MNDMLDIKNKKLILISANPNKYNHRESFNRNKYIDWAINLKEIEIGDYVAIYFSQPYGYIKMIAKVIESNLSKDELINDKIFWNNIDDFKSRNSKKRIFRLQLITEFSNSDNVITFKTLKNMGIKSTQRARVLPEEIKQKLLEELNLIDNNFYLHTYDINSQRYKRNLNVKQLAIKKANYQCELNKNHKTFIKEDGLPYMEAHHLIPLSAGKYFSSSLDIIENTVSLCCNYHREIHQGKNKNQLIEQLYIERNSLLADKNLCISLEELKKLY